MSLKSTNLMSKKIAYIGEDGENAYLEGFPLTSFKDENSFLISPQQQWDIFSQKYPHLYANRHIIVVNVLHSLSTNQKMIIDEILSLIVSLKEFIMEDPLNKQIMMDENILVSLLNGILSVKVPEIIDKYEKDELIAKSYKSNLFTYFHYEKLIKILYDFSPEIILDISCIRHLSDLGTKIYPVELFRKILKDKNITSIPLDWFRFLLYDCKINLCPNYCHPQYHDENCFHMIVKYPKDNSKEIWDESTKRVIYGCMTRPTTHQGDVFDILSRQQQQQQQPMQQWKQSLINEYSGKHKQ